MVEPQRVNPEDLIVAFTEINISQLDKGFLVNIFGLNNKRVVIRKDMLAYDDIEKKVILNLVKKEFKIE